MIRFLSGLSSTIAAVLGLVTGAGAALALFLAWNTLFDNPSVAKAAREGFVVLAEKTALEARLAEERRRADAARKAVSGFAERLAESRTAQAAAEEKLEQEIAAHEQALRDAGRSCPLDQSDIDWLRNP